MAAIESQTLLTHSDFIMRNHRVHGVSVLPGVVFFDVVYRTLVAAGWDHRRAVLREVLFTEAVATKEDADRELRVTISEPRGGEHEFQAESRWVKDGTPLSPWRRNLVGTLVLTDEEPPGPIDLRALKAAAERVGDMEDLYARARAEDIRHGDAMKCSGPLHLGPGHLLAELRLAAPEPGHERFHLHPAALDASTIAGLGQTRASGEEPFIPVYVREFRAPERLGDAFYVYAPRPETLAPSGDVISNDYGLYDVEGRFVAGFTGLSCKRIRFPGLMEKLLEVETPQPAATVHADGDRTASKGLVTRLRAMVAARLGRQPGEVPTDVGFYDLGLDSVTLVRLGEELEQLVGQGLYPTLLFEYSDIDSLAAHLAATYEGIAEETDAPASATDASATRTNGSARATDGSATWTNGSANRTDEAASVTDGSASARPADPGVARPAQAGGRDRTSCYREVWVPQEPGAGAEEDLGSLVVIAPGGAGGGALEDALRAGLGSEAETALGSGAGSGLGSGAGGPGGTFVRVHHGPEFEKTGERAYRLDARSRRQTGLLLADLAGAGRPPRHFVLLGTPGDDGTDTCLKVWSLACAIIGEKPQQPVTLTFLHGGGDESAPAADAVGALARTISTETPVVRCRAVSLDAVGAEGLIEALRDSSGEHAEHEIRYRRGARTVRRWVARELREPRELAELDQGAVPFKKDGVYVVAGGAGGIGRLVAEHLENEHHARPVVISRTAGERADLARRDDVERAVAAVRDRYGRIDGVIHCAGVQRDGLYFRQEAADIEAVLAPKTRGVANLDAATKDDDLDFFLVFSSLAASLPNPGQSAYAYANAYLEAFARWRESRHDRSGRTLAISWPYWEEGGMRIGADALERSRQATGLAPLPTADALSVLTRALAAPETGFVVLHGDEDRVSSLLPAPDPGHTGTVEHHETRTNGAAGAQRGAPVNGGAATQNGTAGTGRARTQAGTAVSGGAHEDGDEGAVAVIGLAGRYPQAPDLVTFWRNLVDGRDSVTEVPASRWDHDAYYDPDQGREGRTYGKWGGFIDGVDRFDRAFFGISRRDAERMDPQERLFLQTCWHTLEDAGYPPGALTGENVGVFAGVMWNHYQLVEGGEGNVAPLAMHASIANRVSYTFDLDGPSMALDTSCSSSLTATHMAVESLRRGECTLALAGGVNVNVHPQKYLQLAQGRFLSPDGRCRAFGKDAGGYVPGEGVGAVLLKPLAAARRDGDHIYGVIRASAVNHTGRTSGATVPDPSSQAALIGTAVRRSGWDPATIGYIEAHGTGTSLGDPIEVEGLRKAFASTGGDCAIGSVKSNIGHLEGAAGIAGLTKVLLQMKHRRLVPSLHADELNPRIDFARTPFHVQRELAAWPHRDGAPRRAGVSAFGAGGANAHILLEEHDQAPAAGRRRNGPCLFVLSARSEEALRDYARSYVSFLDPAGRERPVEPGDGDRSGDAVERVATLLGIPADQIDTGETLGDLGLDAAGLFRLTGRPGLTLDSTVDDLAALESAADPVQGSASAGDPASGTASADEVSLSDLAYTSQVGRTALPVRLALVVTDTATLRERLDAFARGDDLGADAYTGTAGDTEPDDGPGPEECVRLFREGRLGDLAGYWASGVRIPWPRCYDGAEDEHRRVSMPTYPFQEERCWVGGWRGTDRNTGTPLVKTVPEDSREKTGHLDSGRPETVHADAGRSDAERVDAELEPSFTAPQDHEDLGFAIRDGVALVTMNSGPNMFTDGLVDGLRDAFAQIAARDDVKAVVVTGADKVFSMGGTPEALRTLSEGQGRFTDVPFLYEGMLKCDRPVIAAIQGHASGGGLAYGLYADVVLMAREGVYSANFMKFGFTPGMGATYVLEERFGRSLAHEMLFTGRSVSGEELERRGVNVAILPQRDVLKVALRHARSIAGLPLPALRALKGELAGRVLGRLTDVVASEVELHERVLGQESASRVETHFNKIDTFRARPASTPPPTSTPPPAPTHTPASAPTSTSAPASVPAQASAPVSTPASVSAPLSASASAAAPASGAPAPASPPVAAPAASTPTPPPAPAPATLDDAEVREVVMSTLTAHLYLEPDEIDDTESFSAMGLDSIGAVEIVRDLNRRFELDLDSVAVYDHPTIPALVEFVQTMAADMDGPVDMAAEPVPVATPEATTGSPLAQADASAGQTRAMPEAAPETMSGAAPGAVPATVSGNTHGAVPEPEPRPVPEVIPGANGVVTEAGQIRLGAPGAPAGAAPSAAPESAPGQIGLRPVGKTAPDTTSAGATSAGTASSGTASAGPASVDAVSDRPAPVGPASARPAPVGPVSDRPAPVGPASARPAPVGPASARAVPADSASVSAAPAGAAASSRESLAADVEIAVIGVAGRFPDAPDLAAFWENLAAGRCSVREVPSDRFDISTVYDPDPRAPGRTYSKWAAMLSDVDAFDAGFFSVSPLEAEAMDPQQRLFLEEAWHALEDAGYATKNGGRRPWGTFVGCAAGDYARLLAAAGEGNSGHAFLGNVSSVLPARIAYLLNFSGPTLAVDTACSSSLVAVHLACESIRRGECEAALAGGVAVMTTAQMHIWCSSAGMLSPSGTCAPFDASADGIVLGEGVGVVVLKRLDQALRDGDTVRAVIRGSGTNGDGATNGITAPSSASQAELLTAVHRRAGVRPGDIDYVEAHGTGTALGDPIEAKALTQVFGAGGNDERVQGLGAGGGDERVQGLGSLKANIGHTTTAAGIGGLVKVLLALDHRQLPPSPNYATANPKIDFGEMPLKVVTELSEWRPGPSGRRTAAVSSFGFSGTNCHVVVSEPQDGPSASTAGHRAVRRSEDGAGWRTGDGAARPAGTVAASGATAVADDERVSVLDDQRVSASDDRQVSTSVSGDRRVSASVSGDRRVSGAVSDDRRGSASAEVVVPVSARGEEALTRRLRDLADHLAAHPGLDVRDVAYTLAVGRSHLAARVAVVARDLPGLESALRASIPSTEATNGDAPSASPADAHADSPDASPAATAVSPADTSVDPHAEEIAARYGAGENVDWEALYQDSPGRRIPLPTYPFARDRHWVQVTAPERTASVAPEPSTPTVPSVASAPSAPSVERAVTGQTAGDADARAESSVPDRIHPDHWIVDDHRIMGTPVLPGVACLVMAAERCGLSAPLRFTNVRWLRPFEVTEPRPVSFSFTEENGRTRFTLDAEGGTEESVASPDAGTEDSVASPDAGAGGSAAYAKGTVAHAPEAQDVEPLDLAAIAARCPERRSAEKVYTDFDRAGLHYGPAFQVLRELRIGSDEALAVLSEAPRRWGTTGSAQPTLLDGALQTIAALRPEDPSAPAVPFAVEAVDVIRPTAGPARAYARRDGRDRYSVWLADERGQVCVRFTGVTLRTRREQQMIFVPAWREAKALTEPPTGGRALVLHTPADEPVARALLALHEDGRMAPLGETPADLAGTPFDTVYVLARTADPEASPEDDPSTLAVFRLVKSLIEAGYGGRPLTVKVVVAGALPVEADDPVVPHAAGLVGLTRTIGAEYLRWRAGCVDVGSAPARAEDLARRLRAEDCAEPLVALRDRRLVRTLEPHPASPAGADPRAHAGGTGGPAAAGGADGPVSAGGAGRPVAAGGVAPFRDEGVYMIVGGTGGIGQVLGRHLARTARARLALVGRGPSTEAVAGQIAEIESLGGQAVYLRADVADPHAVREAVAATTGRFGSLNGAFHAALALRDMTLADMDETAFAEVLAAKVAGSAAFAAALSDQPLDFLAFFSSAASFVDAGGQANYAAASTFEDSYALRLAQQGRPASVVNWGFWGSVGAVARGGYADRFAAIGIGSIEPQEGIASLSRIMREGLRQAVVVKGTPQGLARMGVRQEPAGTAHVRAGQEEQAELARARAAFAALDELARSLLFRTLRAALPAPGEQAPVADVRRELRVREERGRLFDAALHVLAADGRLRLEGGTLTVPSDGGDAAGPSPEDVLARFPDMQPHVRLLTICVDALADVLSGVRDPMEVLFPGGRVDLVEQVYRGQSASDYFNRLLAGEAAEAVRRAHDEGGRTVRLLEVGAGTGAATAFVLPAVAETGAPVEFTYTDISPAFLRHGEETFGERFPFVSYALFDVERDPAGQGFEAGGHDVVLATNVLHATADIERTLRAAAALLRPGGVLLVNEVTRAADFLTLTFGLTPGWWRFADAERRLPHAPLLGATQWHEALRSAGLTPARTRGIPGTPVQDLDQCVLVGAREPAPAPASASGSLDARDAASGSLDKPVRAYIKQVFAEVLKYPNADFGERLTFDNFGIDSLVTQNIIQRFEQDLGSLPATLLFENLTIDELAGHLVDEYEDRLRPLLQPAETPATQPSAPLAVPAQRTEPFYTGTPVTEPVPARTTASASAHNGTSVTESTPSRTTVPESSHNGTSVPESAHNGTSVTEPSPGPARVPGPRGDTALDIAVVAVTGRYPQSPDLDTFWRNLAEGANCITEVPEDRIPLNGLFDPKRGCKNRTYSRWGGFIEDVDRFDPAFFGILPRDAEAIDPQERLFLETSWELLEDAGYLSEHTREPSTGVFVGTMYGSYGRMAAAEGWPEGRFAGAHSAYWSIANRVSYVLDLRGPSFAVDSACSSSLTAIQLACESLRRGECAMAIAGGVNLILHPAHHVSLCSMNMLSGGDACRVFDESADGFVPGEGVGAVLLKPLARAVADGDRIHGVIKGAFANAGGKTAGYTVPNPNAQADLVAQAIRRSGVDPATISYVEAHGTGTALGDPIEIASLTKAFRATANAPDRCAVGSVKANIGHLEGAAGIAGLTKVLLQMRHGRVAPCANLVSPNPKIDFKSSPFYPPTEQAEWARPVVEVDGVLRTVPRRAGVSSFGAGGANVHIVVEEYMPSDTTEPTTGGTTTAATGTTTATTDRSAAGATASGPAHEEQLVLLSARTGDQLKALAGRVADLAARQDEDAPSLRALAYTSQVGRAELPERLAARARDLGELARRLRAFADTGEADGVTAGTAGTASGDQDLFGDGDGEAFVGALVERRQTAKLGRLWVKGVPVDWRTLWPSPRPRRVTMPAYPFDRRRYWLPGTASTTPAAEPAVGGVAGPTSERAIEPASEPASEQVAGPVAGTELVPAVVDEQADARCTYLRPVWERAPLEDSGPMPSTVLVLAGDDLSAPGFAGKPAGELTERLTAEGARCVLVTHASTYARHGDDVYALDLTRPEDVRRLAGELAERDALPGALVQILSGPFPGPDPDALAAALDRTFYPLLWTATAVLAHAGGPLRAVVAHTEDGDGRPRPHHAALAAVLRTLAMEHSRFSGATVALPDAGSGSERIAAELRAAVRETAPENRVTELRYRDETRWRRSLEPFRPGPASLRVRRGGTYLITGGAGAIGLAFAGFLASNGPVDLVLTGRSPLDDETRARLEALPAAYVQADVRDPAGLARLVQDTRRRFGPVNGVIHAAGVHRDARAARKERADAEAVLGPKVLGTVLLDEALREEPLDFLALFSSVAAETGNLGQVDYTYANAFLNRYAELRESSGRGRTVSICWPLWEEGGMTVDDVTRRMFERRWGSVPMGTRAGLTAFARGVAGPEACLVVVEGAGETEGRPEKGRPHVDTTANSEAAADIDHDEAVRAGLRRVAAGFLLVDEDDVDLDADLTDSGFDSISIAELVDKVNEMYGLDLLPTVLFEASNLSAFCDHLVENHAGEIEAAHRSHQGEPVTMPGSSGGHRTGDEPEARTVTPAGSGESHTEGLDDDGHTDGLDEGRRESPGEDAGTGESAGRSPRLGGDGTPERRPEKAPAETDGIAVIGMAGTLPGSPDLDAFWRHLAEGDDLVRPVPQDRIELRENTGTAGVRAGFLDDVRSFDAALFGISPKEAATMDPQQRLFLQTVWRTIEDAGYRPSDLAGTSTGLFAGVSACDYDDLLREHGVPVEAHTASGVASCILANRVSHVLDLRGPSEAIDTACSSSLVALHRAVRAIEGGECATAIAGGVNLTLSPGLYIAFTESGMLSDDGACKTFDERADGYARGEGCGAVLLKPLATALADGDQVLAVIKGSAVNHGGRGTSLTAPNPEAQADVLVSAYRKAGVDPGTVSHIEAHGTGTRLGDPIEIEGMKKAFDRLYAEWDRPAPGEPHVAVTSVKTNIGHLEAAAGIAGLLKVLLCMRHGELPPTIHFDRPNPYLRLDGTPFYINDRRRPWDGLPDASGRPVRRAGVSSFGFGGTNAHVVLEAYESAEHEAAGAGGGPRLLVLSARTPDALDEYARRLARFLARNPDADLDRVACTLQLGRDPMAERLAVPAENREAAIVGLTGGAGTPGVHRGTVLRSGRGSARPEPVPAGAGLEELARAWVDGAEVAWRDLWPDPRPRRMSLPGFPFERVEHWFTIPSGPRTGEHPEPRTRERSEPRAGERPETNAGERPVKRQDTRLADRRDGRSGAPSTERPDTRGRGPKIRLRPSRQGASPGSTAVPAGSTAVPEGEGGKTLKLRASASRASASRASASRTSPSETSPSETSKMAPISTPEALRGGAALAETTEKASPAAGVEDMLRERLSGILGTDPAQVAVDTPFAELGLDSIFRMELVKGINAAFSLDLQASELYEYDTVGRLSQAVEDAIGEQSAAQAPAAERPAAEVTERRTGERALAEPPQHPERTEPVESAEPAVTERVVNEPEVVELPEPVGSVDPVEPVEPVVTERAVSEPVVVELPEPVEPAEPMEPVEPVVTERVITGSSAAGTPVVEPAEAPVGEAGGSTEDQVAQLVSTVVGRELDPRQSFADNGLTSFEMLRVVSTLEKQVGALPKTLLFDQPTVDALAAHLDAEHGAGVLRGVADGPAATVETGHDETGDDDAERDGEPLVVAKRRVAERPALREVFAAIDREHAKEGGLAGRDIAPLAFLGADRKGYLNFSQNDGNLLAWSYVGSEEYFPKLIEEYAAHAEGNGFKPNFLSMIPVGEVAGRPYTATPFGAVQRLDDLAGFTLKGGRMERLRYMVRRFSKNAECRTVEHRPGEDPAVDREVAELVDRWGDGKQMVNPYVAVVRQEIEGGSLDTGRHRVFLTYRDDVLSNAVIITKIPSENAYLLDAEFYPKDMPLGGLEFAITRIIEALVAEGVTMFSFGASFGVQMEEDAANAAEDVTAALDELRSVGIFGEGNFQFKNKFRPVNVPIYLCQPAGPERTSVADVILMIADPHMEADAGTPAAAPTAAPAREPAPSPEPASSPETGPAREATPSSGPVLARETKPASAAEEVVARGALLAAHGHNPIRVPADQIETDLITDSWAELDNPHIRGRMRELTDRAAGGPDAAALPAIDWLPFPLVVPTGSGRSAEALLCASWRGRRGTVLHNGLFPTWYLSLVDAGFDPVQIPGTQESGEIDAEALRGVLAEHRNVSFVCVEVSDNAAGGYPISPANLREVKRLAAGHGASLVVDGARIVENAVFVADENGRPEWDVVADIFQIADHATVSLSKDFGVTSGGLLATRDGGVAEAVRERVAMLGRDVGLHDRKVIAAALDDRAAVSAQVRARMEAVATLWQGLADEGVPVVAPAGGHCVLLDVSRMEMFAGHDHPIMSCLSWMYRETGIRGGPHLGREGCVRLAVPVGFGVVEAKDAAARLASAYHEAGPDVPRLVADGELRGAAAAQAEYRPAESVPEDVQRALRERHRPKNENLAVLRERNPEVEEHLVGVPEGDVEVFTAGSGPALLLMHPFNIGAGVYAEQFAKLADSYRLVSVHHPGVGRTTAAADITLPGIAKMCHGVLGELGVEFPVHVAGWSFGGLTALSFALLYPKDTSSLILIASSHRIGNRVGEINRLEVVAKEDFDHVLAESGSERLRAERESLTARLLRSESMDPQIGLRYLDVFADRPDLLGSLPEITMPALIVQGAHDTVIPRKTAHLLHGAIPDARYVEIADAGHFPGLTSPDAVNTAITEFLGGMS
ncbi:SDR family NAD(P)-dependent oxidoreductase [Sphaerisporangium dianthi]|uniref:SDR family NAD(P)-dependent oxidoreductase n=1 Tax=Sphaerisporangium dianthi TaxID=1436120 RepID=A0ABV9CME1_9ACTN